MSDHAHGTSRYAVHVAPYISPSIDHTFSGEKLILILKYHANISIRESVVEVNT